MPVFDVADSLGSQSNEDIGFYLTSIDDLNNALEFIGAQVAGQGGVIPTRAWKHTGSTIGFIDPTVQPVNRQFTIQRSSAIQPDRSLIGQSINISLDHFYVHNYPGLGTHNVLFDFSGKSQIEQDVEGIRHPLNLRVNDQAHANVSGSTIFWGLKVDQNGVAFEGRSINVTSDEDSHIVSAFESITFKSGLAIIHTTKPLLKPYTALTIAAVTAIANRSKNKQVHNFNLGLDFTANVTSSKLRKGSYLVIQSDDQINLDDYRWNQATERLEHFFEPNKPIDFNYLIIGVSDYTP